MELKAASQDSMQQQGKSSTPSERPRSGWQTVSRPAPLRSRGRLQRARQAVCRTWPCLASRGLPGTPRAGRQSPALRAHNPGRAHSWRSRPAPLLLPAQAQACGKAHKLLCLAAGPFPFHPCTCKEKSADLTHAEAYHIKGPKCSGRQNECLRD